VAGNELAHPESHDVEHHGSEHGAAEHGEILAPDQLKPTPFKRLIFVAALVTALCLPLMAFVGNHEGNVEKVFLVSIAGLIVLAGIVIFFLKKAGLRN
jgi:uncharacterized protein DUF2631